MPQFFFKLNDSKQVPPPSMNLPNLKAARREAVMAACRLLSEQADEFWTDGGDWQMSITDEFGLTLFTLILYATNAPAGSPSLFNSERRLS